MLRAILWAAVSLFLLPRWIPALCQPAFTVSNGVPISWGLCLCVTGCVYFLFGSKGKK